MEIIVIILVIIIALLVIKQFYDKRQYNNIVNQLSLVTTDKSLASLKYLGVDYQQKKLVELINRLLANCRQMEKKLKVLDRNNKQMIASISHDFRTPLTSMLGYVQMLQKSDQNYEKYLNIIEERTKNLSILVEDFYAISIIDSSEYPINIKKNNPIIILQESLAMYYEDIKEHFSIIDIDLKEEFIMLPSDAHILNRIYANLIKNALTHGINEFRVTYEQDEDRISLHFTNSLKDSDGIDVDKLFERTFRVDTNRQINSTGLGLSIAQDLATLINANLSATIINQQITFALVFKK